MAMNAVSKFNSATMKHLVLVGACYMDTILTVPYYPQEDSKLRATSLIRRRGGNCPNSLEVLCQLLHPDQPRRSKIDAGPSVGLHLISCLPDAGSSETAEVKASFGGSANGSVSAGAAAEADFSTCIYREGQSICASSYITRSNSTGSRTIVNYNPLDEMTAAEFATRAEGISPSEESLWHFEDESKGRIPDTTLECIRRLRSTHPKAVVSVEIEKPGRGGLQELATVADIIFYSRSWAESRGYEKASDHVLHETPESATLAFCTWGAQGAAGYDAIDDSYVECKPEETVDGVVKVVDTVGAGDTFIAGVLYTLACTDFSGRQRLDFSVGLATRKVMREGFGDLAADTLARLPQKVVCQK